MATIWQVHPLSYRLPVILIGPHHLLSTPNSYVYINCIDAVMSVVVRWVDRAYIECVARKLVPRWHLVEPIDSNW